MLRIALTTLLVASAALPAVAQIEGSSVAMTCRQSAGLVRARGAVVLGTGGQTYDRFVSDRRFCQVTEQVRPAFAPTRDDPACLIGYTCFEPSNRFSDDL
ncbi:hypothetical protein [uncultured Enterovirga sp.]|uniref:hypothetical protein n=1 Tax=uncultured Enterovirga sp. TaxID=2026352 RepID=UPI0035C9ED10